MSEDPPTIRLLFKHKNEDQVTGTDQFYSERKRNCCVACGEARHYLRYRVSLLTCDGLFSVHGFWLQVGTLVCSLYLLSACNATKKDRPNGINLCAMQVVPACYRRAFPVHLKSHRRYCS